MINKKAILIYDLAIVLFTIFFFKSVRWKENRNIIDRDEWLREGDGCLSW